MAMRWWVLGPDQKPYGPYEADALAQHARDGRVRSTSLVCPEGSEQWVPASTLPELASTFAAMPNGGAPVSGAMGAAAGWQPVSLVGPILVTVFCCLIGGIISIIYATQANSKAQAGNLPGAMAAAGTARTWMWVSVAVGLGAVVIQGVILILGGALSVVP
jgi:Interferon-induced transmembrane protein/GYF domain 2